MIKIKRFLVLAAAAMVVLGVSPARAEGGVSAQILSPGNGQVVSGTVNVKGFVSSDDGLESITLVVNGTTVGGYNPNGNSAEASYLWDTKYLPKSGTLSRNGDYSAYVKGVSKTGAVGEAEIIILVDNAPTVPQGVGTSVNGSTVTVSWRANPEPDIVGYRVERSSGGGWTAIGTPGGTSMQDNPGGGNHSYRVTALRSSPSAGTRTSVPSATSRAFVNGAPSGGNGSGSGEGGFPSSGESSGGSSGSFGSPGNVGDISGKVNDGKGRTDLDKLGGFGLPTGLSLPGITGLIGLPQLPSANTLEWGEYQTELPYDLPNGNPVIPGEIQNIAARAPDRIIPPDGLRWVAAGLLLLMGASMMRYGAVRLGGDPAPVEVRFSAVPAPAVAATAGVSESEGMARVIPMPPPPPVEEQEEDDHRLQYLRARF